MREQCSAKTRSGAQCKARAVSGKAVCRVHGGKASGPNVPNVAQNALKHGIYGRTVRPDEVALFTDIRANVGRIDDEIAILRLQLVRTLDAQNAATENDSNGLELQKYHKREANEYTAGDEHVYERVDYNAHIDRLTGRIAALERIRSELLKADRENPPDEDNEPPQWVISVVPPKAK